VGFLVTPKSKVENVSQLVLPLNSHENMRKGQYVYTASACMLQSFRKTTPFELSSRADYPSSHLPFLILCVQLLSEPYTNSSRSNKQGNSVPWGDQAEASKGETMEHDLRNRGLCLVPVSWTPEVYRDGNAMDYWTPAYRGCLYRWHLTEMQFVWRAEDSKTANEYSDSEIPEKLISPAFSYYISSFSGLCG
jgi:hypothetical protein